LNEVIKKTNANLKSIAEMAGLSVNPTTYVARHTYTTVLKRSGVNVSIISQSLGHSNEQITQTYLDSIENDEMDKAMKNLL
jgi:integrase